MKVLITGGFGYVGGRLAKHLDSKGFEIFLGSQIKRPPPRWLKKAKTIRLEWSNSESLSCSCSEMDIVIHAAGMNALDCEEDPKKAMEFNGLSSERLAKACVEQNVKKLIFFSSALTSPVIK